ncbi:MAG TPA: hypothetical protein VKB76_11295 [Ktedonobacterales bacterium]|nr:hypothetical protein [Ktedonobacterales bacterium]
MTRATMRNVQAAIDKRAQTDARYRNVEFVKGEGYFYLVPKNLAEPFPLDGGQTTSIYVYALNQMPLDHWMTHIESVVLQAEEERGVPPSGERNRD